MGTGALVLVGLIVWFVVIPYPRGLSEGPVHETAVMQQRMDEAASEGRELTIRHEWVPLSSISPNLKRAVVVAEDYRFRVHQGIDWVSLAEEVRWSGDEDFSWLSPSDLAALARASWYVWSNRDELRGRSTLTQQLAKNLYFGTDRSLVRKLMEAVVAQRLERRLSKDRILELYLNLAEWGPGIFGAEAAARSYFGVPASRLSLEQAAALAATLPHPLTSNPRTRPGRMAWRRDLILDRLDPARGLPEISRPIPPPDPEMRISPPEIPDVGPIDTTPAADTAGDSIVTADTMSVGDTLLQDGPVSDTVSIDVAPAVDTTSVVDTGAVIETTASPMRHP